MTNIVDAESVYALQLPLYVSLTINEVTVFHIGNGLFISENPALTMFERNLPEPELHTAPKHVVMPKIDNPLSAWREHQLFRTVVPTVAAD